MHCLDEIKILSIFATHNPKAITNNNKIKKSNDYCTRKGRRKH